MSHIVSRQTYHYHVEEGEDLRIIKLIFYLFKEMSGLAIKFYKTYLYITSLGKLPNLSLAYNLDCSKGFLPSTYLGTFLLG